MKTNTLLLLLLLGGVLLLGQSCNKVSTPVKSNATSIGIVIYSNDIETVWNALRFANNAKAKGDLVSIFLLGKGVELENLIKTDKNVKEQTDKFLNGGGTILGCGTCLESRNTNEPQVCKFSSMNDLYDLVHANSIVMTF